MRRMPRGLLAALESEQIAAAAATAPAAAAVDPAVALIDHSDTVETGLMEIADSEAAHAQIEDQTDEATEVATALESIAVCLKAAAGNGGLSRDGAQALNIAVAHMQRRVGINPVTRSMPALESYGSVSSRVTATQLAMESLKVTAGKIWQAIVDAIRKSITWLQERWQLFFGTAEKLKKRAAELAATAQKTAAEKPKTETIDNSGLVAALHVAGKVDGVSAHIDNMVKLSDVVFGQVEKRMEAFGKAVEGKTIGDVLAPIADMSTGFDSFMKPVTNPEAEGLRKPADGAIVLRSDELPGGKAFIAEIKTDVKQDDAAAVESMLSTMKHYVGDFSSKTKPDDGAKLPVLTPADAGKLAVAVGKIAETIEKYQAAAKKIAEAKEKLVARAEELAKAEPAAAAPAAGAEGAKPAEGGEQQELGADAPVTKALRSMMAALGRAIDTPVSGTSVYMLNTGKRALDYVTLSLEAYGAKVEGKADDKAAAAPEKKEGDKPAEGGAAA